MASHSSVVQCRRCQVAYWCILTATLASTVNRRAPATVVSIEPWAAASSRRSGDDRDRRVRLPESDAGYRSAWSARRRPRQRLRRRPRDARRGLADPSPAAGDHGDLVGERGRPATSPTTGAVGEVHRAASPIRYCGSRARRAEPSRRGVEHDVDRRDRVVELVRPAAPMIGAVTAGCASTHATAAS